MSVKKSNLLQSELKSADLKTSHVLVDNATLDFELESALEQNECLTLESLPNAPFVNLQTNEKVFKGLLKIYTSKNNVHYVLTDITGSQVYTKLTGGQAEKKVRGCEKNSLKHSTINLEKIIDYANNIGLGKIYVYLTKAYSVKGHLATLKSVQKLLSTGPKNLFYTEIINESPVVKTKLSPKGGSRGRKR